MTTFSRDWDTTYEASPPGSQAANQLDTRIQEVKVDIRERFEVEHQLDEGSQPDPLDGVHKFPAHSVTTRDAISSPKTGQLVVRSDTRSIDIYDGSDWVEYQAWTPGDMKMAAYDDAAALGWQKCDGSAISRTTYADLFAVVGVEFGVGDGSTTFNVPDMSGKFPIGIDAGGDTDFDAMAETGGEKTHVLLEAELAQHTHGLGTVAVDSDGAHTHDLSLNNPVAVSTDRLSTGSSPGLDATSDAAMASAGAHTHTLSGALDDTGSDTAHNNMPPFITMQWYIKL